jgi:hypothetical protein
VGWFCTEIIAQPSSRIIELLRETPGIDRSLYFVPAAASQAGPRAGAAIGGLAGGADAGVEPERKNRRTATAAWRDDAIRQPRQHLTPLLIDIRSGIL